MHVLVTAFESSYACVLVNPSIPCQTTGKQAEIVSTPGILNSVIIIVGKRVEG